MCIRDRVGGVFNSRYGWFDQGTTEGPSAHLHREFISALYNPNPDSAIAELGSAHTMSKIKTAPWIGLPGEFEPGAQRWCFYDCNVLGDPALKVWIDNPLVGTADLAGGLEFTISPNPAKEQVTISLSMDHGTGIHLSVLNSLGQQVYSRKYSMQPGSQTISLNVAGLTQGIYYVRLDTKESSSVKKLMVVK